MKTLAIIVSLAALSGCATTYPGPANYGSRAYAPVSQADADGWQVVSVTPVPLGTGSTAANGGVVTSSPVVSYSQAPVAYGYSAAPVYAAPPIYAPAPLYADPFWYPPISIGLGFSWSNWGHGYHGGPRGGWGRGGGNWGRGGPRGHR
jgi:hypothetical protein